MYIDLFSIIGKYKGMSTATRGLGVTKVSKKKWMEYFSIYEEYMKWQSEMDNTYSASAMQMLIKLRDERVKRGAPCEIVFYSDNQDEFHLGKGFVGFDAYWAEEGLSGIEEGCHLDEKYLNKLNENGLFSTYNESLEFCSDWKKRIDECEQNPWAKETTPRPFCVWKLMD